MGPKQCSKQAESKQVQLFCISLLRNFIVDGRWEILADRLLAAGLSNLGTWAYVPRLRHLGWRWEILADRLLAAGLGNLGTWAVPGLG